MTASSSTSSSPATGPAVTPSSASRKRLLGPDVTRAMALIGVVVMNYHGYLNGSRAVAGPGASLPQRLFDPWTGVLSTRFAATFMLVAGVGVSLMTSRSCASGDRAAVTVDRWRLIRRGMLLYAGGFVLDWIWPGTILFFYGAAFVMAAFVFTLHTRWLISIGCSVAVAAAGLHWWVAQRAADGNPVTWFTNPQTLVTESPRGLVLDTFVNGTHPMLPWFAFMCLGMIIGRSLHTMRHLRWAVYGAAATAITYLVNHIATSGRAEDRVFVTVLSTRQLDRGLLYTIGTAGTAVAAFCVISVVAEARRHNEIVQVLARAGQMTLSLYVLHVLVFNLVVHWLHWVGGTGLDTALMFALVFWALAIAISSWWRRLIGVGPLESLYRKFGG